MYMICVYDINMIAKAPTDLQRTSGKDIRNTPNLRTKWLREKHYTQSPNPPEFDEISFSHDLQVFPALNLRKRLSSNMKSSKRFLNNLQAAVHSGTSRIAFVSLLSRLGWSAWNVVPRGVKTHLHSKISPCE